MSLRRHICQSSVAFVWLLAVVPVHGAEPSPPPWTADQLIEVLDVEPDQEVTFVGRGLKLGTVEPADKAGIGIVHDLRILFQFNSAELTPDARRALDQLAVALGSARLHDDRFRVAGHTDGLGSETYNLDLSLRRAEAAVDYLERAHGMARGRLVSQGFGETQLFDPENPVSAANRRVEIVNLRREEG